MFASWRLVLSCVCGLRVHSVGWMSRTSGSWLVSPAVCAHADILTKLGMQSLFSLDQTMFPDASRVGIQGSIQLPAGVAFRQYADSWWWRLVIPAFRFHCPDITSLSRSWFCQNQGKAAKQPRDDHAVVVECTWSHGAGGGLWMFASLRAGDCAW